jgi:hypothetical protein
LKVAVNARANERHVIDVVLMIAVCSFAATSFLFDRAAALDLVAPDSPDPLGRAVYWYGMRWDPLVAENPLFLRVMSGISAFVFGPFCLWLARGLWRGTAAVRMPALVWATAMTYSMIVHVIVEVCGEVPPPNLPVFVAIYTPYAVVPLWIVRRVWAWR